MGLPILTVSGDANNANNSSANSNSNSPNSRPTGITIPAAIALTLLTWAASAGVTYGILSTRLEWQTQRIDNIERELPAYIPRQEYQVSRSDLDNRLDRIERKIDALK